MLNFVPDHVEVDLNRIERQSYNIPSSVLATSSDGLQPNSDGLHLVASLLLSHVYNKYDLQGPPELYSTVKEWRYQEKVLSRAISTTLQVLDFPKRMKMLIRAYNQVLAEKRAFASIAVSWDQSKYCTYRLQTNLWERLCWAMSDRRLLLSVFFSFFFLVQA